MSSLSTPSKSPLARRARLRIPSNGLLSSPFLTLLETLDLLLSLPSVKQFQAGDVDMDKLFETLTQALVDDTKRHEIRELKGDTAVLVIECLDEVSEIRSCSWCRAFTTLQIISSETFKANSDVQMRTNVYATISRLSRGSQYLPRSYWINSGTITLQNPPHTSGTCAEVYRGTQDGKPVAVKVLRTSNQEDPAALRKASAEGCPGSSTRGRGLTG